MRYGRFNVKVVKRIRGGGTRWQGMNAAANRSQRVGLRMRDNEIRVTQRALKYQGRRLLRHEATEKRLMDRGMPYGLAHYRARKVSGV